MKPFLSKIYHLENPIQNYDWGSRTELSRLFTITNIENNPQAELWIGAHHRAPSLVKINENEKMPLDTMIDKYPDLILGKKIAKQYNNNLPFLFKILTAKKPLSIQTHPDLKTASSGFDAENSCGVAMDDNRNYKDPNHKPELIYALTEFNALYNFKTPENIINSILSINSKILRKLIKYLEIKDQKEALKKFYSKLMHLNLSDKSLIVSEIIQQLSQDSSNSEFVIIQYLNQFYPEDFGILAPLYMNHIKLLPGDCMFIESGEIHSYLNGSGFEIMANSDNVIRGGLTNKHIDFNELIKVLNFNFNLPKEIAVELSDNEMVKTIQPQVNEFGMSILKLTDTQYQFQPLSTEMWFCSLGNPIISDLSAENKTVLKPGEALLIPASLDSITLEGVGEIVRIFIPDQVLR